MGLLLKDLSANCSQLQACLWRLLKRPNSGHASLEFSANAVPPRGLFCYGVLAHAVGGVSLAIHHFELEADFA